MLQLVRRNCPLRFLDNQILDRRTAFPRRVFAIIIVFQLDGSAHAQFLFQTEQGDRVMKEILRFLTAKN